MEIGGDSRHAEYAVGAGRGRGGALPRAFVSAEQMELAQRIFETVGRTVVVDEKHMDAVTGLSGRGRRTSTSSSRRWRRRA
jgi:pyrroline-5-carboxylate reductase